MKSTLKAVPEPDSEKFSYFKDDALLRKYKSKALNLIK